MARTRGKSEDDGVVLYNEVLRMVEDDGLLWK